MQYLFEISHVLGASNLNEEAHKYIELPEVISAVVVDWRDDNRVIYVTVQAPHMRSAVEFMDHIDLWCDVEVYEVLYHPQDHSKPAGHVGSFAASFASAAYGQFVVEIGEIHTSTNINAEARKYIALPEVVNVVVAEVGLLGQKMIYVTIEALNIQGAMQFMDHIDFVCGDIQIYEVLYNPQARVAIKAEEMVLAAAAIS